MTYLHSTPPPKNNINPQTPSESGNDAGEPAPHYSPDDMGDDHGLNPARQRELLCKLHNRLFHLSFKDSADHYYKLTNSITNAQKGFSEITKGQSGTPENTQNTGKDEPSREEKITAICDLVADLTPADYDADKLAKRAAMIAANYNAAFGDSPKGGHNDDA